MENEEYWQDVSKTVRYVCMTVGDIGSLVYVLKENEYHPNMNRHERRNLFSLLDRRRWQLQQQASALADMVRYGSAASLAKCDRVPVNRFCHEIAGGHDVEVAVTGEIPDRYTVVTDREALEKLLYILVSHAVVRVLEHRDGTRVHRVELNISERADDGVLTFAVSDTGEPLSAEEIRNYFNLPADGGSQSINVSKSIENYNCRLLSRLLGGFIYIDPKYKDGLRVVFSIAI